MNEGLKERLKSIREVLNLTQQGLADKLKTSRNNIAGYESGTRTPSEAALNNICVTLLINEEWLRNGTGEMFIEQSRDEEITNNIIPILMSLDEEDWKLLLHMAITLVDKQKVGNAK